MHLERRNSPGLLEAALFAACSLCSPWANAMTVNYQCVGYRPLAAEFTPREAQLHFEGQDWTLVRLHVRDPGEAHYVDPRAGVSVVTKARQLTLTRGGQALQCFLKSDALQAFQPASAPLR